MLNYPPYTTETTPTSINPGKTIMIAVLAENTDDLVDPPEDTYDVTVLDGFYDYDSDYPLSVVADSWSYGGFFPGEDLQY